MRRLFLLASLVAALPKRVRGQDAVPSSMVAAGARILAQMIQTARAKVIAGGVKPVPIGVHRGLLGYFPDSLLRKARFAAGQDDGATLPALAFGYGHAAAVTLGEVVVFRDPRAAETDLKLWAHELTHVLQYQRWGIDGFAERYVSGRESVEKEAYDNADRFAAWRAR